MSRFIDSQELVDWCNKTFQAQSTVVGKEYVNAFLMAVVNCPTADVVEVVRCKDCKHWHKCLSDDGSIEYIHFSRCIKGNQLANGNDYFCSYGKRKTD